MSIDVMITIYVLCGIVLVVVLLNMARVHVQIVRLQKRGLYPKEGEQLTPGHISILIAKGEHAYAARLTRRLYGVSLRKAVDQIKSHPNA